VPWTDVDAARRLVEQEHVHVVMQQPRDRDLLLVAAGEAPTRLHADAARMPRRSMHARDARSCAAGETMKPRLESVMLSAMLQGQRQAFGLRSSLTIPTPCRQRARSCACRSMRRRERDRASPHRAEDRAKQFGASRADESCDPEHLAAPKF
jgi:hypothetical protein